MTTDDSAVGDPESAHRDRAAPMLDSEFLSGDRAVPMLDSEFVSRDRAVAMLDWRRTRAPVSAGRQGEQHLARPKRHPEPSVSLEDFRADLPADRIAVIK